MSGSPRALTAADALLAVGVDLDVVRRRLPLVEPTQVRIAPASRFMRRFWATGISAVCMPWAVYVTPAVFERLGAAQQPQWQAELVVHELVHLQQYRAAGPIRHVARYGLDYWSGRRHGLGHWNAYLQVAAEIDARRIAAEFRTSGEPR